MKQKKQETFFSYYHASAYEGAKCCFDGCEEQGEHKILRDLDNPKQASQACFMHAQEHNRSVDYFQNKGIKDMERFIEADVVWRLPSWPLRERASPLFFYGTSDFEEYINLANKGDCFKKSDPLKTLPHEIQEAVMIMELSWPLSLQELKKVYKMKVKKHHPDLNQRDKNEEALKRINVAYKILYDYLMLHA